MHAYSEDVRKFTNDDLQRYNRKGEIASGKQDISGTWKFVCCSGKYWGEIDLDVDENNRIKGKFYDKANKSGGSIDGTINGNTVIFTRNNGEQDYKLTLSEDGNTMSGFFVGVHDGSVGTEVTMTRAGMPSQHGFSGQEEILTPWKDAQTFGKEMDQYWKNGYYPAFVEGRNHEGQSHFRKEFGGFIGGMISCRTITRSIEKRCSPKVSRKYTFRYSPTYRAQGNIKHAGLSMKTSFLVCRGHKPDCCKIKNTHRKS